MEEPPKKSAPFVLKHWSPGPPDTPRVESGFVILILRDDPVITKVDELEYILSISKEGELMIGI